MIDIGLVRGAMKLARWIYLIAGIYGILVLAPALFRPPQGAPEFYYGFIGLALAWQLAFFVVARDPIGFRALMPGRPSLARRHDRRRVAFAVRLGVDCDRQTPTLMFVQTGWRLRRSAARLPFRNSVKANP
jgi:hypothetical protein